MLGCDITEPRLRCVVPFKAMPAQMALLRRATAKQLRQWGTPVEIEDAELLVTELASNVVKHVGEGEPATLILELDKGRLRLEVHDTSPVSPSLNEADGDQECGRGLHLIAFIAAAWGTAHTAVSKSVWCEIASARNLPRSSADAGMSDARDGLGLLGSGLDHGVIRS
ncbi:ATP-binding protein [Streptomyces antibioticus]|uniref:ATP-binding protein n=1 Tax=Streptomyces antibioticus TaxID=1890 RepID=UPI0033A000CB